jgi:hypothetical protein
MRGGDDRGSRRDFTPRQPERQNDDMKKQLEAMNTKFDRLIKLVETFVQPKAVEVKELAVGKKKVAKKAKKVDKK